MNLPFIDIHTHSTSSSSSHFVNCRAHIIGKDALDFSDSAYPQVGIHPWFIGDFEKQKKLLLQVLNNKKVQFIGECGLDKRKGGNWNSQIEAFTFQVQLATKLHMPLIVHCVKAHQEIIGILKAQQYKGVAIFHGFVGSVQLAQQITNQGFYLSIGQQILTNNKLRDSLQHLSIDKLYCETDESNIDIETVYHAVSQLNNIETIDLKRSIYSRFSSLFSALNYM